MLGEVILSVATVAFIGATLMISVIFCCAVIKHIMTQRQIPQQYADIVRTFNPAPCQLSDEERYRLEFEINRRLANLQDIRQSALAIVGECSWRAEMRAFTQEAEAQLRAIGEDHQRKRIEADTRALQLLREWLSPKQRKQFDESGGFIVRGSNTGLEYRIMIGRVANVCRLAARIDGAFIPTKNYCGGPQFVPMGDFLLAQKIWLENDEQEFLRVANVVS